MKPVVLRSFWVFCLVPIHLQNRQWPLSGDAKVAHRLPLLAVVAPAAAQEATAAQGPWSLHQVASGAAAVTSFPLTLGVGGVAASQPATRFLL
jgi:hypothetical protein